MLNDEPWEQLVPQVVAEIITQIDGVNRLKEVSRQDRQDNLNFPPSIDRAKPTQK
jgi:nicotinamide-nucleotide adenylyltransferase